ncbi:unnamed protein product [Auanema sp. JU1783]|nr:unnamed protein product [Auanema sp. JU1783]
MESNLQYAVKEYWNERFSTEESFEWLKDFSAFQHLVLPELKSDSRILHIGCGNSQMSMRLLEMGFKNITNLDYSEKGREKYPEMDWVCDDIRSLESLQNESFDVVLEKATIEALLVGEKSAWNPSDEALVTVDNVLKSIRRVLAPRGVFISISFTQPHFRVPALLRDNIWHVQVAEFGDSFHYFVYICRTNASEDEKLSSSTSSDRFRAIVPGWSRAIPKGGGDM